MACDFLNFRSLTIFKSILNNYISYWTFCYVWCVLWPQHNYSLEIHILDAWNLINAIILIEILFLKIEQNELNNNKNEMVTEDENWNRIKSFPNSQHHLHRMNKFNGKSCKSIVCTSKFIKKKKREKKSQPVVDSDRECVCVCKRGGARMVICVELNIVTQYTLYHI